MTLSDSTLIQNERKLENYHHTDDMHPNANKILSTVISNKIIYNTVISNKIHIGCRDKVIYKEYVINFRERVRCIQNVGDIK